MKARHVLFGCGIAALICVIGAAALVYWAGHAIRSGRFSLPPQAKQAGVKKSRVPLSMTVFLNDPRLGSVTDIVRGKFDRGRGIEIGIAGTSGAAFVDANASPKAFTPLSGMRAHVDIIDVDNDGNCEFLDRGSWVAPATLMDHSGGTTVEFPKSDGVDDTSPGDIDGDGRLEFAIGYNGGGGVSLFDARGTKMWNKPDGNVWHVEMVDSNNDGRLEIVHSNAGGQITVRSARGDIISQASPAEYFSHFSLCRWPTASSPPLCLSAGDQAIWLFNYDGRTAARFAAPSCRTLGNAAGTLVKLQVGKPDYMVVVASYRQSNRSILYLFDSRKKLVYEETLPEQCASIAALKLGAAQAESILVGGEGRVWRYDLSKHKP